MAANNMFPPREIENWTVAETFLPLALSPRTRRKARVPLCRRSALRAPRGEVG